MNDETLRKLQMVELDILKVVDKFCRDNNISYSLYAGTALGAVRHQGFIPWDDDIDICMDRNEYNRFLKLWRENNIEGYTLAGDDEKGCHINHSKILKDNTILSTKADMEKDCHHGIWLDVFAFDKIPTDRKKAKAFLFKAKLRLIYTRDYPYTGGNIILNLVSRIILFKTRKQKAKLRDKLNKYVQKYKDLTTNFNYIGLACPAELKVIYPSTIFTGFESVAFENWNALISSQYDTMLKLKFGDYMQLPPIEDRVCKHNPEVVNFGDGNC